MKATKATLEMQRNIRSAMIWDSLYTIAIQNPKSDMDWVNDCATYRDNYLKAAGFPVYSELAKHH